ncbi:MAG: biotin synthase BioB [Candidatus Omnitrophica bacterium]|nr:biotin synthase BioB [Candidatus Omnitrophota bacterium]
MSDSCQRILQNALSDEPLSKTDALGVLSSDGVDLLILVAAAYQIRHKYFSKEVTVHILNNVQNGLCSEDCQYCAQSTSSSARIEQYPMKSDAEIMAEAKAAWEQGAHRYCMVFSGAGPSDERIDHLSQIIREIKKNWPLEVCVSPGVITSDQAKKLKAAGLDRLNHNLNTSERHYKKICTTHSYSDRLATLRAAKSNDLAICSGVIIGMGETADDVFQMALIHRDIQTDSIPVNFLIPIPGIALKTLNGLTPEYCLRVLCLFRLMNPRAEIRMAAGREIHLRALEPLGLYVANSLFLQGYLNARGSSNHHTLQMIKDLGFSIKSDVKIDEILLRSDTHEEADGLKSRDELRPFLKET